MQRKDSLMPYSEQKALEKVSVGKNEVSEGVEEKGKHSVIRLVLDCVINHSCLFMPHEKEGS